MTAVLRLKEFRANGRSVAASAQAALDDAGIRWEMAVESGSTRAVEATISADLAVHTMLAGSEPPFVEQIPHQGLLPDLGRIKVNLYVADPVHSAAVDALAVLIRRAYAVKAVRGPQERVDAMAG
jgi:hypothetical protein